MKIQRRGSSRVKYVVAFALLLAGFALPAQAAPMVTVTNTDTFADQGNVSAGHTFSSFNLMGGNTVAALVSHEDTGSNGLSVTYGGAAADGVVTTNEGVQVASVYYWIGATTGQDLVVTPGGSGSFDTLAVSAVALSNVGGVSDTATGTETSGTGTEFDNGESPFGYIGEAGGLSVAAYIDNTFDDSSAPFISGASEVLDMVVSAQGGGFDGGSAGYLHGYGAIDISANDIFDQIIEGDGGSSREAGALVAFEAIVPEPGALTIWSLLGLISLIGGYRSWRRKQ